MPSSARVPACPANSSNCLTGIDANFEITRSDYDTTIKINGVVVFNNLRQPELGMGQVGPTSSFNSIEFRHFKLVANVPKLFPAPRAPEFFFTLSWIQFSYQANIFQPLTGLWGIGGVDSSYGSGIAPLGVSMFVPQGPGPGPDYFLNTNLVTETPVNGTASAGLAYELTDAQDYYDVALAVDGTATLNQTIAGVRTVVATAQWQGGQSRSFQLGVIRFQDKTSIEVDGQRIFNEVPQVPLVSHGWGVTSNELAASFNFISTFYNF